MMTRTSLLIASAMALCATSAATAQTASTKPLTAGRQPMPATAEPATPVAPAAPVAATAPGTPVATTAPAAPAAAPAPAATTTIAQALPTLQNRATLNKLVTAANLTATLAGPGPFTVFAPSDEAFSRLPAGALDTLMKPEAQASLATILKYHVVAGALTADQLKQQITAGGGKATLTTLAGQPLTASLGPNGNIELTDVAGSKAYVDTADVRETNGIIHLTNGMSVPKIG